MAEFGWAYVSGLLTGGVSGSVQVNDGALRLSGSNKLVYNESSGSLNLTGSLNVSGAINANQFNVNVINKSVTNLSASGDTKFGDSLDDKHQITGSVYITGSSNPLVLKGLALAPASSSAHYLAIDSNYNVVLTSSDGGPGGKGLIKSYTNPGNNRIVTSVDSEGINAEANLVFNGEILTVTGDVTASGGLSASVGQFTYFTGSSITDGTLLINNGSLTSATTVNATNLGGTLTTAAQANVTSVGTLTALNVAGDLSASALFVSASNNRVAIGINNPEKKLEIYDKNEQLRLTYSKAVPFLESNKHTDLSTNSDGYLILSPSGQRVGIGTTTPTRMLDVDGHMRVSGNLEITGALHAKVSEFVVTANNITFGDDASDTLTFNAASGTAPNGLNLDSNTWVLDTANNRVGIGAAHPTYALDVETTVASAFRVKGTTNGVDVNCGIENTGTESDDGTLLAITAQPGAGDPAVRFAIPGTETWSMGIDNSDNDKFKISQNSTLHTDTRLTIQGNKIGIGTTTPEHTLQIDANSNQHGLRVNGAQNKYTVSLRSNTTTGEAYGTYIRGGTNSTDSALVVDNASGGTTYLRVRGDGNVGIGTTDPSTKLEVAGTITATNLAGTLTTAAQPNVTSVGNLTGLTVDTSTLVVDGTTNRVGVGITNPRKPLEVLHSSAKQLRLSQQQAAGLDPDVYTDFQTNSNGYLLIDPSGNRVGIGTSTPKRMLDVDGHMRVSGNLEITGALHAKVSEFIVTADNITFGQDGEDTLIFNAASGTVMNGLNWDNDTWVMDSDTNRIGIGVAHPDTKLQILTTNDQLKLSYDDANHARFAVDSGGDITIKPTGGYITGSCNLKISGSTFLGTLATHHTVVSGKLSASVAVSSSEGRFTNLSTNSLTDGTATLTGGNLSGVGTVTATSVGGTLSTAAQPNVTSVGTLSSLTVSGDLTVDSTTLKVDSSTNRIGVGVADPQKPIEVSSSSGGLRLTYSRYVFGESSLVYSDLSTDSNGKLVLESSGNKTKVVGGLEITGLAAGTGVSTKYLALDSSNNIVLTRSVAPGIETRNRRVINGNSTLSEDDYYIGINASTNVTLTLVGAETLANGQTFTIKDEGGNANSYNFRIEASGSQVIDGESFVRIQSPYGAINLYTNGSDKYFIF